MNIGLYSGVSAARANQRRLEAITGNLANLNTPAYKRVSTGTRAFSVPSRGGEQIQLSTYAEYDFTQGDIEYSSNPYHMALMGTGFFTVGGPEGELYTRNGSFHVNQDGMLITDEGFPIEWRGANQTINPTGEPVTIDGDGNVKQGRRTIGQIKIADFADPGKLSHYGGGYFAAPAGLEEQPSPAIVHQRSIESSNVMGVDELVAMISVQRNFESARNVMQMIDQTYARLTSARS